MNGMDRSKLRTASLVFFFVTLSVAVVSVALRTLSLLFFYDTSIGYYEVGAALPIISNIFTFLGVVFALVFPIARMRSVRPVFGKALVLEKVASVVAALSAAAITVSNLMAVLRSDRSSLILAVLSAFCVVWCLTAFWRVDPETYMELGALVIVRIVIMLATSYFDQAVQMNAPDKVLFGVACAAALFFIVCEMRVVVGTTRSWSHIFVAAATAIICLCSSVPSIIAFHAGKLPVSNGLYFEYYLLLAVAIVSLSRLGFYCLSLCRADGADAAEADGGIGGEAVDGAAVEGEEVRGSDDND